ncbi:BadF/BadG/BcrA/BcrD ATPase family protein [Haloplasma contractile]|uniref:N-acetylglucosamine kinase protein n=1 Tax=Haloplasma contractile SSD-17B TaxID=1033810 RepID=F7PU91_9MOLU|nr:BadF/BadG/BcrA/BcrD ATPase family protein [Haloplasma contractile]ERJ11723.1 N-acetylglucosamine kinase protein [Haloplasma contractile SSD-17B]
MSYVVGFDGGGTKTRVVLGDLEGNILRDLTGRGSNHQSTDVTYVETVLGGLYEDILTEANVSRTEIQYVYLGLSGADLPSDFKKLETVCSRIFYDTSYLVLNDAWLILRSGLNQSFGAVAISGTGTNSAAINKYGKRGILRALGFTLGIYGGGLDIAREGLHYAFRSDEYTYKYTSLEEKIPKLFNVNSMEEVVPLFYPKIRVERQLLGQVTRLVFESASEGDEVSQELLIKVGSYLGNQTAGVIKQVEMENEAVPVVIGGTVFKGNNPLLIDSFTTTLHRKVPRAYIVKPMFPPVYGAYLGALDELNIKQTEDINRKLNNSLEKRK